jgi:hypothetical protein
VGVTVDGRVVEVGECGVEATGVVVVTVTEDDGLGVEGPPESGGVLGDDAAVAGVEEDVADESGETPLAAEAARRRRGHAVVGQDGDRYHRHPWDATVGDGRCGRSMGDVSTDH